MTAPGPTLYDVVEATWPPARSWRLGPWTIRDGAGGGKRVSAATAEAPFSDDDFARAETAMADLGQPALFMIRDGEDLLDQQLAARGYRVIDPVVIYSIAVARLLERPLPPVSGFALWPPLAIMRDLWAAGGIGPARIGVMDRAQGPKTAILGRSQEQPAGVGFVAIHDKTAMIHAIEVAPKLRRLGTGRNILGAAAAWAQDHGATDLSLVVTRANTGANALYAALGMVVVGQYHYRIR